MAAIMLQTGLILETAATRDQVLTALASAGGVATGTINGVQVTVRAAGVLAVSDTLEGLRPSLVMPFPDPNPPVPPVPLP